nr:hypothetical protein [Sorangium cellulosum]
MVVVVRVRRRVAVRVGDLGEIPRWVVLVRRGAHDPPGRAHDLERRDLPLVCRQDTNCPANGVDDARERCSPVVELDPVPGAIFDSSEAEAPARRVAEIRLEDSPRAVGHVEREPLLVPVEHPSVRSDHARAPLDDAEGHVKAIVRPDLRAAAAAQLDLPGEAVRPAVAKADIPLAAGRGIGARELER